MPSIPTINETLRLIPILYAAGSLTTEDIDHDDARRAGEILLRLAENDPHSRACPLCGCTETHG